MKVPALPTIADYLDYYSEMDPDRILAVFEERRVTYAEAASEARRIAGAMLATGVGQGDRVSVYSHPHVDTFLIYLAAVSIGAIFVGHSPKQRPHELRAVISAAKPKLAFMISPQEPEHVSKLAAAVSDHDWDLELITLAPEAPPEWITFTRFVEDRTASESSLAAARASIGPDDPVAMVYTSGSTGPPRGALLVNAPMARSYAIQADHWYTRFPVGVADLPVHHLGFISDNCSSHLVAGGTVHILDHWTPERVLATIERERLTFWWTQTTMLLLASRHPDWVTTDFSSLERISFGGAPITDALRDALEEKGIPLGHGYGMTEVHGNATYVDNDSPIEIYAETIGKPDPRIGVSLIDRDGNPCTPGETGEIVIKTDTLFGGYRSADGAVDRAVDELGRYRTRDLGMVRPDGNLVLMGRVDDMFKSGGFNVYPREVEQVLATHPAVVDVAVVDVDDPTWTKVSHAYVLLSPGSGTSESELKSFASEHLANYKVPKAFRLESELPMMPSGKVDKRALRERSAKRSADPS